jgi:hypothetical protein
MLDFCEGFCRSLFVLLSFFFWPLSCLFFFDFGLPLWYLQSLIKGVPCTTER